MFRSRSILTLVRQRQALRIYKVLEGHGVTDVDWANVVRDDLFAAAVAHVLHGVKPEVARIAFSELVTSSSFTTVNVFFEPEHDDHWTDKGDRVRGEFHVLRVGKAYHEGDLALALEHDEAALTRKRGCKVQLSVATAYEQVAFAVMGLERNKKTGLCVSDQDGWNGTDTVIAWGSRCIGPSGDLDVPCLWGVRGDGKGLSLRRAGLTWTAYDLVLCVIEKVPEPSGIEVSSSSPKEET